VAKVVPRASNANAGYFNVRIISFRFFPAEESH
jgi:hypothetical protein